MTWMLREYGSNMDETLDFSARSLRVVCHDERLGQNRRARRGVVLKVVL